MRSEKTNDAAWKTVTIFLVILAYYSAVSIFFFPKGPTDFDEYGYFHQAKLLTDGKLVNDAEKIHHKLRESHVRWSGEGLYSKYPPGFIFVLAVFMLVGLAKIANPIAVTLGLFISYKIMRRFLGQNASLAIIFLGAISPYATGYAASFYSQPLAFLLCSIVLWAFIKHKETDKSHYLYVMGVGVAYLFLTRPTDAAIILICLGITIMCAYPFKRACKLLFGLVPMAVAGVVLFVAYFSIINKKLVIFSYRGYVAKPMSLPQEGGSMNLLVVIIEKYIDRIDSVLLYLFNIKFVPLVGYLFVGMAAMGIIAILYQRRISIVFLFLALVVGLYNFHYSHGWPSYGARYWYVAYGSFLIMAALGWWGVANVVSKLPKGKVLVMMLGVILAGYQLYYTVTKSSDMMRYYDKRFRLSAYAKQNMKAECPEKTIVVVMPRIENSPARTDFFICDSFLNENGFGDRKRIVIYFHEIEDAGFVKRVQNAFPGYNLCPYQPNHNAPKS